MPKGPFAKLNPFSKDRNDQARLALARGQFQAQVDAGNIGAYDRLKRKLDVGDYVVYRTELEPIWEVTKIEPVTDDSAPPGTVRVHLGILAVVPTIANTVNSALLKVGERPKVDPIEEHQRIANGMAPDVSHDPPA